MAFRFRVPFDCGTSKNLIALVLISLIVLTLEHLGWLLTFENTALDTFLLAGRSKPSNDVFIIEITEDDFRESFQGKSPLDVAEMRQILSLIEKGEPRIIGVDIDTSSSGYRHGVWPQAVWVRDAIPICDERAGAEQNQQENRCPDARRFLRFGFLGGGYSETELTGLIETQPCSGVSLFPVDRDGVVRRFRPTYYSDQSDPPSLHQGLVDSFPRAILRARSAPPTVLSQEGSEPRGAVKAVHRTRGDGEEDLILNFSGDRYQFPRMTVKQLKMAAERNYWTTNSPIKGKIVLLGGAYRSARDVYLTPVGARNGVEITAQAIESELSGGGLRPINHWIALLIDLAAGFGLILLNKKFHGRFMLLINALFIVAASLLGSYLSFNAMAYWFNFTAVLVSIWIHVLWERESHFRETQEELKTLEADLKATREVRDQARAAIGAIQLERDDLRSRLETIMRSRTPSVDFESSPAGERTGDEPRTG